MSIPKPLLWTFLILILIFAYAKAFTGAPIWDDLHFIFWRFDKNAVPNHALFWRYYIWPMFDSTIAILYQFLKEDTFYWHVINFGFHLVNGWMLRQLVVYLNRRWATPFMILFWLHPLNVLSVAWIIQLKTVMCGFFVLASAHIAIKWWKNPKAITYILALVLFALGLLSKSSALPLPWLVLSWFVFARKLNRKILLAFIPFLILTLISTWRIWKNDMVQTNVGLAEEVVESQITTNQEPPPPVVEEIPPEVLEAVNAKEEIPAPVETTPEVAPPTPAPEPVAELAPLAPPSRLNVIVYALGSYLAYPFFPWPLSPVHGAYLGGWDWQAFFGYFVVGVIVLWGLFKRSVLPLWMFLGQAATLVPFLGFIVAPYMTYTTVSEQHYYFVLPFALVMQLWVISQLPKKLYHCSVVLLTVICFALTNAYTGAFKDEVSFYEWIQESRPQDRVAALNLAGQYAHNGQMKVALRLIEKALREAEEDPRLKQDPLHPLLEKAKETYEQELQNQKD